MIGREMCVSYGACCIARWISRRGAGALDSSDIDRAIQGETPTPPLTPSVAQAQALYAEHGFNLSAAARAAGMARTTFRKLLKG